MDIFGVSQVVLSKNKQSVFVHIPELKKPVMQLEVRYSFQFENGTSAEGVTYYTIHQPHEIDLAKAGFSGLDLTRTAIVARVKDEGPPTVEMGKSLSLTMSCVACHSIDGAKDGRTGPTWKGLFGSKREFTDNSSASADENYLRDSIIEPQRKIVKGFAPGMASYSRVLSDKQIEAMIMYIRSLQ
jgi:mono/diheme cytochrome c family protein